MKKTKFIVLVGDGMADYPLAELGNKTPLEAARTPNMDFLAKNGKVGLVNFVPKGMPAGSDIATLSIFGYDPQKYFAGRGPLEAINLGIELNDSMVVFRCNLITVENDVIVDYSAGHISCKEAHHIIAHLNKHLSDSQIRFYPGVSYRHILTIDKANNELVNLKCFPPHDILGKKISEHLPKGEGNQPILDLMLKSRELLSDLDINHVRVDLKENPANMIWLWGQGKQKELPLFKDKYGISGSVISAVDLIKGIGKTIGLEPIAVPGATGYYDTNFAGKAKYAIKSLKDKDFVFVHVEAPDEAGHNGDIRAKIQAIENFDRLVVGNIVSAFKSAENVRIAVMPDHPTPIALKTHSADPVCFLIYGKGVSKGTDDIFNEAVAAKSSFVLNNGWDFMEKFIQSENL